MRLIDFFDGPDDMAETMRLVSDRVLPILDWLDAHEDEGRRVKVSTALFVVLTIRAVKEHGLRKVVAREIVSELIDAINADEIDDFIPPRH